MKQRTAKSANEVFEWVENKPHHKASSTKKHLILENHNERLRIPHDLPDVALRPGDPLDKRMFRWDGGND